MIAWIKARWRENSTRFGALMAALGTASLAFAPYKPELAYIGWIASTIGGIVIADRKAAGNG